MLPGRKEIEKFFFQLSCFYFSLSVCSCSNFSIVIVIIFPPLFFFLFLCNWICLGVSGRDRLWVCEKISRHLEGF